MNIGIGWPGFAPIYSSTIKVGDDMTGTSSALADRTPKGWG